MKIFEILKSAVGLGGSPIVNNNPHMELFSKLGESDKIDTNSLLNHSFDQPSPIEHNGVPSFESSHTSAYSQYVYAPIPTNKLTRLHEYRNMMDSPEIGDAIDEIVDAMLNTNDKGQCVELRLVNSRLNETQTMELRDEFNHFINLFQLDDNLPEYARKFCIEGQVCFENIIDKSRPDKGIIGVKLIDNEDYEFLVDTQTMVKTGIFVYQHATNASFDAFATAMHNQNDSHSNAQGKDSGNDGETTTSMGNQYEQSNGVPFLWPHVTYIDTGKYSTNKLISYPVLDRARRAYRQLSLIENAIIIYRLARAPERLSFNISTGKLSKQRADEEVLKLAKRYQTKRYYNPVTGSVTNDYDPHQIQENFFFAKPEGQEGTTVSTLSSAPQLSELPDLDYFQEKLYTSLKVPFTRRTGNTVTYENAESMSYEEHRFAKFVVSLQKRFAVGLLRSFRSHLELLGMWGEYALTERDLRIMFVAPSSFEMYTEQRLLKIKYENYDLRTKNRDEMSKEIAMIECLGKTEAEITSNNLKVEEERKREAYLKYMESSIASRGNSNITPQET